MTTSPYQTSLAAAHAVVNSTNSLLAAVHPVLAPLGAAVVLRPSGGAAGGSSVHITRTQRRGGQRRATGIAGPRRPAAAYAARSHEFAAAAAQLLGGTLVMAPLTAATPAPVLRELNVCDKRAAVATHAHARAQPQAPASDACAPQQRAERPCFFSLALALHSSML